MEQSEIDTQYSDMIKFIVEGVMIATCCGFGMLANIICMFIMSRPALKKGRCASVNALLMSMAGVDIIVLVTSLIMCGFPAIAEHLLTEDPVDGKITRWILEKMELIFLYTLPYVYPIGLSAQTASVYLTLVVTIERFIVVCKPLEARSICTVRRTRIIILLVCLFGLTFNLTRFLELKHVWIEVPVDANEIQISETNLSFNDSVQDDNALKRETLSSSNYKSHLFQQNNPTNVSKVDAFLLEDSINHSFLSSGNFVTNISVHFNESDLKLDNGDDKATTELELGESSTIIETIARLEYTPLRLDPLYIKVSCWTYLAIMYVIPFIALLLFNVWIGVDLRQATSRRKCMTMLETSQYKIRNHVTNEYSNIPGLEMNIIENLAPCYDSTEEVLEKVRAILCNQSNKVVFGCSLPDTIQQEEIVAEDEPTPKLRSRSINSFRSSTIRRQQIEEREQHGLAIMQMVVVLVFVTCNFLAMLCNIFELFGIDAVNVTFLSNFLVTLNHSVNLFIYCAFGERFRKELKREMKKTRRKIGKCFWIKSENESDDLHFESLELHNSKYGVRKSNSLPKSIEGSLFRKVPKSKTKNKFYSEDIFDPRKDS